MKNFIRLLGLLLLGACRSYQGPVSDHFDGKEFYNPWQAQTTTLWDVMKWKLTETAKPWPSWVENKNPVSVPLERQEGNVKVTFINHASFLIEVGGVSILTDPVWSERTSPVSFAGPKRVRNPGIEFDKLPKIDAVVVSHNHYDHMDLDTLQKLAKRDNTTFFVPLGDKKWLEDSAVHTVKEMDWWDKQVLNSDVSIYFAPAQHWSARGVLDRNKSLWGSFLIEYKGKAIYIAGDTGYGPHFQYAAEKFPNIELALLPIGAYEPRWFMKYQHMNPEDSVKAFQDLKAKHALGMHFGCWQLTDEAIDEPQQNLETSLKASSIDSARFLVPEVGGTYRYNF